MKRQAMIPLLGVFLMCLAAAPAVAAGASLEIQPPALTIGTFYAGQSARLSGQIADGQEVVLEIKGPSENVSFDLKGRVGPFWMNRGLVKVDKAPSLYILLLPSQPPAEDRLAALGLGMTHLKEGVAVNSPGQDPAQIFAKFLDFKKDAGLYQQRPGAVTYAPAGPGRLSFSAVLDFPSSLAAGRYEMTATVLQEGAPPQRLSKAYLVDDGAFLKLVKDMAYDRALLFGVLCVAIALFTGAVMGLVFRGGKGGH